MCTVLLEVMVLEMIVENAQTDPWNPNPNLPASLKKTVAPAVPLVEWLRKGERKGVRKCSFDTIGGPFYKN